MRSAARALGLKLDHVPCGHSRHLEKCPLTAPWHTGCDSSCILLHLGHLGIQKPDQTALLEQSDVYLEYTLLKELELYLKIHFWVSFLEILFISLHLSNTAYT